MFNFSENTDFLSSSSCENRSENLSKNIINSNDTQADAIFSKDPKNSAEMQVLLEAQRHFNVDICCLSEIKDNKSINILSYIGFTPQEAELYSKTCLSLVEGEVYRIRAPIIISNTDKDPRFLSNGTGIFGGRSIFAFPVFSGGVIICVIGLHALQSNFFNTETIKGLGEFASKSVKILEKGNQEKQFDILKTKYSMLSALSVEAAGITTLKELETKSNDILEKFMGRQTARVFFLSANEAYCDYDTHLASVLKENKPKLYKLDGRKEQLIYPIFYETLPVGYFQWDPACSPAYFDLLRSAAQLLASVYKRIEMSGEIALKKGEIKALEAIAQYEMSGVMQASSDLDDILDATLQIILQLLNVERMNIMLYDNQAGELKVKAYWGVDQQPLGRDTLKFGEGLAGRAITTCKPCQMQIIDEQFNEEFFVKSPNGQMEIKSILSYPMLVESRRIGVINIGSIYEHRVFTEEEIRRISLVASRAALAVENSTLTKERLSYLKELADANIMLEGSNFDLMDREAELTAAAKRLKESLASLELANSKLTELYNFSKDISMTLEPSVILDAAMERISVVLSNPVRLMLITLPESKLLRFRIASTYPIAGGSEDSPDILKKLPADIAEFLQYERKPILLDNLSKDPLYRTSSVLRGFKSFYAFPVSAEHTLMGIMILTSRREASLNKDDIDFIVSITNTLAVTLKNAVRYKENWERSRKQTQLNQLAQKALASLGMKEQQKKILSLSCEMFNFTSGALYLYNHSGNLCQSENYNFENAFVQIPSDNNLKAIVEDVLNQGKVFYYSKGEGALSAYPLLGASGVKTFIVLPLFSGSRKIGALVMAGRTSSAASCKTLEFYEFISSHIGLIIDSSQLFERMTHEKEKFESVFKSIKEGVITIDWENKITAFNKAAEEITGWTEEEVLGWDCAKILNKNVEEEKTGIKSCIKTLKNEIDAQDEVRFEGECITKEGNRTPIAITASLLSLQGEPVGGVIVFRDITEEKQSQQRRSDYMAAISHDIFTPLTAIKGYTTTLLRHRERFDMDTQVEFVKIINQEIDRVTRLLSNLMNLSKMETDHLESLREPMMISMVIDKTTALYSLNLRKHKIVIDESIANAPMVYADSLQVEQILNNLISNAVKYSPAGGDIIIKAETKEDFLQISVKDSGLGIEKENIKRLFNRYTRLMGGGQKEISGMGLGLFITRVLTELQGGKIWVESEPGKGSTFYFTLPLVQGLD